MRGLVKEQSIILKMSWHLLIPHQIMKYLFEPEAIVSFLVCSTKFIQQSFIECSSVPGPGLGPGDTQRNELQLLAVERRLSPGDEEQHGLPGGGVASARLEGRGGIIPSEGVRGLCPGGLGPPKDTAVPSQAGRCWPVSADLAHR